MARGYEDLSRRALIQLGKDYDQENDAALMQFLADHDEEYEGIRFSEKVIVKADNLSAKLKDSSSVIKKVLVKEGERIVDSVIDAIVSVS